MGTHRFGGNRQLIDRGLEIAINGRKKELRDDSIGQVVVIVLLAVKRLSNEHLGCHMEVVSRGGQSVPSRRRTSVLIVVKDVDIILILDVEALPVVIIVLDCEIMEPIRQLTSPYRLLFPTVRN